MLKSTGDIPLPFRYSAAGLFNGDKSSGGDVIGRDRIPEDGQDSGIPNGWIWTHREVAEGCFQNIGRIQVPRIDHTGLSMDRLPAFISLRDMRIGTDYRFPE